MKADDIQDLNFGEAPLTVGKIETANAPQDNLVKVLNEILSELAKINGKLASMTETLSKIQWGEYLK